jgi:ribosomal protein L18E
MIVRFNKKIYSREAIQKAMSQWRKMANFELKENKNYFLVKISKVKPNLKEGFSDEFSNFALSLMKK